MTQVATTFCLARVPCRHG